MTKADQYREALKTCADWNTYLMQESGLPGPRGNLELARAAANEATAAPARMPTIPPPPQPGMAACTSSPRQVDISKWSC
jgi:hypothetical protein